MGITHAVDGDGIAEVVMDNPPVNALTVAGWFELADTVRGLGDDPRVRVVILRAEGKGFNAGVDIKEMQRTEGFQALVGANRGCFAAFAAVYECAVPVIAAVQHDRLRDAAYALARRIAEKSPVVIRAAKESLNGIDPVDVKKSYRYEQGYTFELNLSGVADEARDAFVDKRDPEFEK